jgi:hypothetical protein
VPKNAETLLFQLFSILHTLSYCIFERFLCCEGIGSEFWYVVAQNGPNNSASVTGIKTLEDFQSVINLAKIDLLIYN